MIVALDAEKAFNAEKAFISRIQLLYRDLTARVQVNGLLFAPFGLSRGTR